MSRYVSCEMAVCLLHEAGFSALVYKPSGTIVAADAAGSHSLYVSHDMKYSRKELDAVLQSASQVKTEDVTCQ